MDWNVVTVGQLCEALREVDWTAPRPLGELLFQPGSFVLPKSTSKWTARVKNNAYYYRTNYVLVLVLSFVACFLRNPLALAAVACTTLGILCLNDPFATALNDGLLRLIKKVHPRTALRLRALTSGQSDGNLGKRRSKQRIYILWLPANLAIILLCIIGMLLMWRTAALRTGTWALLIGLGLPGLHASFRSPNLKARIASDREEFRAHWRGYQAGMLGHDYTQ